MFSFRLLAKRIGSLEIRPKCVLCILLQSVTRISTVNFRLLQSGCCSNNYTFFSASAIAQAQEGANNNKPLKRLLNTAVPTLYLKLAPLPPKSADPIAAVNLNGIPRCQTNQPHDPLQLTQARQTLWPNYPLETLNSTQYNKCIVPNCQEYRDARRWQDPLILYDFPSDLERRTHWFEVPEINVKLF